MKHLLTITTLLFSILLAHGQSCSDTTVYANSKQTQYDKRFESYTKINGQPKYSGGEKKFEKYLKEHLIVDPALNNNVFMLNYTITISCDGKIIDAQTLGDSKLGGLTNFVEIAKETEGEWKPATKDGQEVNCVYFNKMFINGSLYQK